MVNETSFLGMRHEQAIRDAEKHWELEAALSTV
jgi:hypothetical protein